jgi:hypothetical protein
MASQERQHGPRRFRTRCVACRERKARFRFRGTVRADRDHTLCFECFRAETNRARARRLRERAPLPTLQAPSRDEEVARGGVLDARQLAHRQRMLDHLQHVSSRAS